MMDHNTRFTYLTKVPILCLTDGSDYNETRIPVMIKPGDREVTVRVPIVDDYFLEEPEEFTVKLEIPPESAALNVISGSPDTVPVKIADNDGEF